jgi:hypothetical protein
MRRSLTILVITAAACFLICSTAASAQTASGAVRGEVTDASGGVLPGVTVVATTANDRVLATTVTDGAGSFVFRALPAGPVNLRFQLQGFADVVVGLAVPPGAESHVAERLGLASLSETVVVTARTPEDSPSPSRPPRRPPPVVIAVPAHDHDSVCGPAKRSATAESFGTIRSRRDDGTTGLYAKGDELVIDGGTLDGLEVGRNLVVRRYYRVPGGNSDTTEAGEHSSGLLQIVAVAERSSVAVVVYACDELMKGDFLASFTPQPVRTPDPAGIPVYEDAARILFGDAGQMMGAPRRLMVIDRGSDHGIRAGQRLTLFRRRPGRLGPAIVGDAVVVAVRNDSATIRVERAIDGISAGDWAAPQGRSPVAPLHQD